MTQQQLAFNQLHAHNSTNVIYRCIAGSHAYGTNHPHSDTDIRGIYILPTTAYLALQEPPQQVSDARNDIVYYSLKRILSLAANANPNIIELLFMPPDCVLHIATTMDLLLTNRSLFLTTQVYDSHVGYAQAQIKKARGQNKWVNNPQPRQPPKQEDFCWLIPHQTDALIFPYRPIPLQDTEIALDQCHCAAVEHITNLYRLYHYGATAKGVFRNGNLVCESIPQQDEHLYCIGLLLFNRQAYEKAQRDHQHYWHWVNNRNEHRWRDQENGIIDYDAKNMMHTIRLLLSAEHILRNGEPMVRFTDDSLSFLKKILADAFTYTDLIKRAEDKIAELKELYLASALPKTPSATTIDSLFLEMIEHWENTNA